MGCGEEIVEMLDTNLHVCLQWNETCQPVPLSGDAAWPKVADTVIEALFHTFLH